MTKNRLRVLLALIATGAVFASPAVAKADESTFVHDVQAQGFTNSPYALLNAGYDVCNAIADGSNGEQVARAIYRNTDLSVSLRDARLFVITAVEQLCSQFDHRSTSSYSNGVTA